MTLGNYNGSPFHTLLESLAKIWAGNVAPTESSRVTELKWDPPAIPSLPSLPWGNTVCLLFLFLFFFFSLEPMLLKVSI